MDETDEAIAIATRIAESAAREHAAKAKFALQTLLHDQSMRTIAARLRIGLRSVAGWEALGCVPAQHVKAVCVAFPGTRREMLRPDLYDTLPSARPPDQEPRTGESPVQALQRAVAAAGGPARMAKALGITTITVSRWLTGTKIADGHIARVEIMFGVPRQKLRPDLYTGEQD